MRATDCALSLRSEAEIWIYITRVYNLTNILVVFTFLIIFFLFLHLIYFFNCHLHVLQTFMKPFGNQKVLDCNQVMSICTII